MSRALGAVALLALAGPAAAQTPGAVPLDPGTPGWMTRWSPLRPLADLPRLLPHVAAVPDLMRVPAPRVGYAWTVGSPVALALEADDARAELGVNVAGDDGSFRRPLDPGGVTVLQLNGTGWRPMGDRGSVAGQIMFDRTSLDDAGPADLLQPYASDPITLADTTSPAVNRTRAQLEGAVGWVFGPWALGLAVGIETERPSTAVSRFPRVGRSSTPGVAAGVSRTLPLAGLRLAAYGRWLGGSETVLLQARPGGSTAFVLTGFNEPDPIDLQAPPASLFRRVQRRGWSGGAALGGTLGGSPWIVFAARTWRRNHQFTELIPEPPRDRWEADGWEYGAAVQRRMGGGAWLVTGSALVTTLSGEATRADLSGAIFRAEERQLTAWSELRYAPPASRWRGAVRIGLRRSDRTRRDFIAATRTEIEEWHADAAVAVGRWFGSTGVSLGLGAALVTPIAAIPNPDGLGPVYQTMVAAEQSLYATPTLPRAALLTVRHNSSRGTALVLQGRGERLSARGTPPAIPFTPSGDRTVWRASVAVVLDR